jgi:C-terminal processing protease CtpA/Prc
LDKSGEAVISRIERNTPAHFCGRLAEGDRLLAINGEPLVGTDIELWQARTLKSTLYSHFLL